MKSRKSTIHDIADQLGITASTVSRALSGNNRISNETKERVQVVAAELNYQPIRLAANLRTGKGNSIGVVVPRINRNFFSNVISGIEKVTNPAGYKCSGMQVVNSDEFIFFCK
jgi:LacI family transcriptional regulator